ncbi:hypothetical protein [Streptomyces sp. NPDC057718]|uniref:hypothetical protein n=1 Tax=Streptomyces sp. NPDC057718 TaxID=3346225 RepID=UPI00369B1EBB
MRSDLTVNSVRSRFAAIIGPSGFGDLARMPCPAGFDAPARGRMQIDDRGSTGVSERELATVRCVGFGLDCRLDSRSEAEARGFLSAAVRDPGRTVAIVILDSPAAVHTEGSRLPARTQVIGEAVSPTAETADQMFRDMRGTR